MTNNNDKGLVESIVFKTGAQPICFPSSGIPEIYYVDVIIKYPISESHIRRTTCSG